MHPQVTFNDRSVRRTRAPEWQTARPKCSPFVFSWSNGRREERYGSHACSLFPWRASQRRDQRAERARARENAAPRLSFYHERRVGCDVERVDIRWAPSGISLSRAKQSPLDLIGTGLIIQTITKGMKITLLKASIGFFFLVIYYIILLRMYSTSCGKKKVKEKNTYS